MWDKEDYKTDCRLPTTSGSDCTPKSATAITPIHGGSSMLMPTIAGGKNMCLKPSLSSGVYGNPSPNCRDPYIYKSSSKDNINTKKPTKQPATKCPTAQSPIKDQAKCVQEATPSNLCLSKPKIDPESCSRPKCEEKNPCDPTEEPQNKAPEMICATISPDPKTGEIKCCWSLKQSSSLGASCGQSASKANTCETGKTSQRQNSPSSPCECPTGKMQNDFTKPGNEPPRNMIKCGSGQRPMQQVNTKASPLCSPAQKRQQSPCISSQKDVLTISINCSVSEKTNSMQLCVSEKLTQQDHGCKPQEGEEMQPETEECSIDCSIGGCLRAEVHATDCLVSEKAISIQECIEEETHWDVEQDQCEKSV